MKLLSSVETGIYINGEYYEVIVETFKTTTHIYYKKARWAYWSNIIRLKGKQRQKPIKEIIEEDIKA